MVDSTVHFDLPSDVRHAEVTEAELKSLAVTFQSSLRQRGLPVGEIFGSEDDLWGFLIDFGKYEVLFSVSPNRLSKPQRWFADVSLHDPGWFQATRQGRLAEFNRAEPNTQVNCLRQPIVADVFLRRRDPTRSNFESLHKMTFTAHSMRTIAFPLANCHASRR